MSSRKDFKKYLFDKIQDFPGFWEPCKHNQIRTGCRVVIFFSRLGFYLNDPLCIMAILTKEEKETGVGGASEENVFPSRGGMSSINRP